jgi:glycosyltransferase involved in cell wall biosynthesis
VISEAYARGTPIVASAIGPIAEVVADGRTGLHFRPGDVDDLVAKVGWLLDHPAQEAALRQGARAEFEARYTADDNRAQLLAIYQRALAGGRAVAGGRVAPAPST